MCSTRGIFLVDAVITHTRDVERVLEYLLVWCWCGTKRRSILSLLKQRSLAQYERWQLYIAGKISNTRAITLDICRGRKLLLRPCRKMGDVFVGRV